MMKDSSEKRAADSKAMVDREAAKADADSVLNEHNEAKKSTEKELRAMKLYIASLHGECDFLLQYYEQRKEARAAEMDSMQQGKASLSGADYSLVQSSSSRVRRKFL